MMTTRNRLPFIFIGCLLGHVLIGVRPLAAQGGCKPVLDAMIKVINTPTHLYMTKKTDGKLQDLESIYTGGKIYVKVDGKWNLSPITTQGMIDEMKKTLESSSATCTHLKDELVAGQMAGIYQAHNQTVKAVSDTQTWISKSTGLPIRAVTEMNGGKIRTQIRYEYANVKAPM